MKKLVRGGGLCSLVLLFSLMFGIRAEAGHTPASPSCPTCGYGTSIFMHNDDVPYIGCTYRCNDGSCDTYFTAYCTVTCDHSWSWITSSEATCTTSGSQYQKCSKCGNTQNTTSIPALGHSWGGEYVTSKASCTSGGTKSHDCSRCGTVENTSSISARGHVSWTSGTKVYTGTDGDICEYHCNRSGNDEYDSCSALLHTKYRVLIDVRYELTPDEFTAWTKLYDYSNKYADALYYDSGVVLSAPLSGISYTPFEYSTYEGNATKFTAKPLQITVIGAYNYKVTYWRKRVFIDYNYGLN